MGTDEEGTLERIKALRRELLDPKIAERHGRIVKIHEYASTQMRTPQVICPSGLAATPKQRCRLPGGERPE